MTNMKLTKNHLIGAAALGLLALVPNTQYAADASAATPAEINPYSIGVEAGTTGIGGNLGWRFSDYLGVETGFDYFNYITMAPSRTTTTTRHSASCPNR